MSLTEDADFYSRPADSRCHHCGQVFTYRIDKYNHVVKVHQDTSQKKPKDDRPRWDTRNENDAWGRIKALTTTPNAPVLHTWSPTPAEAAQVRKSLGEGKMLKSNASASPDRQPLESTSRGPSELLPDDFDSAACSADERDRAKSDKALWRIALKRSALPQQATDNGQLESTIDPTDVSTSVTISTSSSASRDRYLTSNMSPSRLRPSISDRDYATMGNQGGSDTGVISFCKSSRSYRCRVCSQLFTDHDSFSRHLQESGHLTKSATKIEYTCRVCGGQYLSHTDLKRHIYKKGHHDPTTEFGYLKDEERLQRQRTRAETPCHEPEASEPSLSPASAFSNAQVDASPERKIIEEDLIDLNSSPQSEAEDNAANVQEHEPQANTGQSEHEEVDDHVESESFSESRKSIEIDQGANTDPAVPKMSSKPRDEDTEQGHNITTVSLPMPEPSEEPFEEPSKPTTLLPREMPSKPSPKPSSVSSPNSSAKLSAMAQSFRPQLKALAPEFTPRSTESSIHPSSGSLSSSAVSLASPSSAIGATPTSFPLDSSSVTSLTPLPTAPAFNGVSAPVPSYKKSCWAVCGYHSPFTSGILYHLETGACSEFFTRFESMRDLYQTAANTSCAHDFIDGRYLRDLSMKRDIVEKYKGNAYPFICPNEERCGNVFQQLHPLFAHFERGTCGVQNEAVGDVKRMVEDALASLLGSR